LALSAAPAAAHTDLVTTTPQDGASLDTPPDRITLTFAEDLLDGGDRLVARDGDGAPVDLGPTTVDGARLSATWPATADAGTYRISYRAVAGDGHPLTGTVRFSITAPEAPAETVAPAPAAQTQEQDTSGVRIWAPLALLAALLIAGLVVWRSRAQ
jgi:methionine-rich copper-binding protein CopC